MTEERMIRINYYQWYDQTFVIPNWEELEPVPPKDWKPLCNDLCWWCKEQLNDRWEKCPYRKSEGQK